MDKKFLAASIAIAVAALIVFHVITGYFVGSYPRTTATVTRVIDGDTFEISTGDEVRMLNINTPERGQYYYQEAKNALKILIENKTVELERDAEGTDRYGRLLRYVFVDDKFINLGMVRNGYAHMYIIEPNTRYADEFKEMQDYARQNELGIWKHSDYFGCVSLSGFNYEDDDEFVRFRNDCSPIYLDGWSVLDESSSHVYKFPSISFSGEITLYSDAGTDTSTDLFWGKTPVWTDDRDTVFLRDASGLLVLSYFYP